MLNNITIMGRFVRDPDVRRTPNGISVTSFTLAVDRDFGSDVTDFIDCVAWRNTADFVGKHFTKGRMAVVNGSLQNREYTDKDGNKRRQAEINAEHVYFADSKKERTEPYTPSEAYAPTTAHAAEFTAIEEANDELPF